MRDRPCQRCRRAWGRYSERWEGWFCSLCLFLLNVPDARERYLRGISRRP